MQVSTSPIFSIIIPVYNREHTVSNAIKSVLGQTFLNFELIIVDDCSTDQSVDLIKSFNDNRIRFFEMPTNSGAAAARNNGIKNAKGIYISFLDSDDAYEPDFLKESYDLLCDTSSKIGFMWTGVNRIENNHIHQESWSPKFIQNSYFTFLNALHIGTNSGITIKKEVFEKCGYFNENLQAAEDTDFFLRITKDFDYVFTTKTLMNVYRDGHDRLSKNLQKNAKAYQEIFPQHKAVIDTSKKLQKKYYYKMMWLSFYLPDKKLAFNYFSFLIKNKLIDTKIVFIFFSYLILPFSLSSELHRKLSASK